MFKKEKLRLKFTIISISLAILLASFTTVFLVLKNNINREATNSIERTVHSLNMPSDHDEFAPMEVIVIKENNDTIEYSMEATRRYKTSTLDTIVSKAKDKKEAKIDSHYFYLDIVNTNEETIYIAYDATLAMNNLTTLLISLVIIFVALMILVTLFSFYISNRLFNNAEKTIKSQKEFVENASHELKTPLTIINASLDSMEDKSDISKWINNIKNQTERMNKLIIEMLELARIDNVKKEDLLKVNLSDYINNQLLSYEVLVYEKGLTLTSEIDNNIEIVASQSNIDKMINILLDNSLKYTSENGNIELKLYKEKNHPVIVIKNDGCNITKEDEFHIFDRFYKRNIEDKKSFGLGLAILKSIVDAMNGKIELECEYNKYTKFTITL